METAIEASSSNAMDDSSKYASPSELSACTDACCMDACSMGVEEGEDAPA